MTEIIKVKCRYPDCGHEWIPRTSNPQLCPKCKRRDWDKEVTDEIDTSRLESSAEPPSRLESSAKP